MSLPLIPFNVIQLCLLYHNYISAEKKTIPPHVVLKLIRNVAYQNHDYSQHKINTKTDYMFQTNATLIRCFIYFRPSLSQ